MGNRHNHSPYQKLLLRIIHNLHGLSLILALITAFWTYNTYDGRWGKLTWLPDWLAVEGIHGTFGLWTLLILPVWVLYSFHHQPQKLIQSNTAQKLRLLNQPIGWYSLHRLINTISFFSVTFAVFTGKMMSEKWLPQGELEHFWYYAHLISWLVVLFTLLLHLAIVTKIGGYSLILSMFRWQYRASENPRLWWHNWQRWRENWLKNTQNQWKQLPLRFKYLELLIILAVACAWLISAFK